MRRIRIRIMENGKNLSDGKAPKRLVVKGAKLAMLDDGPLRRKDGRGIVTITRSEIRGLCGQLRVAIISYIGFKWNGNMIRLPYRAGV